MSTEMGRSAMSRKLDAIGWGAFFAWMGVTMLIKGMPAGIVTIGIGVIILAESIARVIMGISVNAFWIIIGVIFLVAGIAELTAINIPLLPIAFIIAGILLILRQTTKTKKTE